MRSGAVHSIAVVVLLCAVGSRARPTVAPPPANVTAMQALLGRVLSPSVVSAFTLEAIPADPGTGHDVFELEQGNGTVILRGNTAVSMATALNFYLKYSCNASFGWEGAQLAAVRLPLPPVQRWHPSQPSTGALRVVAPFKYRYYLNVCTVSYTMVWWDWNRWEREIDWMALQGINLPLAFTGQEFVWAEVFAQLGLNASAVEDFFVGPAFLAWGRMGNIQSWMGPLGTGWRAAQLQLQLRILARMRSLGMSPVLPGFAGHVPAALAQVFPAANITSSPTWAGFDANYSAVALLDPRDPLFANISARFLLAQQVVYGWNPPGTPHVYNADTFNEMVPSSNDTVFLGNLSAAMYKTMTAVDPEAVWMIQGWMFGFEPSFWQPAQIQAYLDGVPDDGMIILDLNAFANPIWPSTNGFYGKPFLWCIIQNAGGRQGLFGNLSNAVVGPWQAALNASSMQGIGLAPEGTLQNPITFELLSEVAWRPKVQALAPSDLPAWVAQYATRRYGLNATASLETAGTVWDRAEFRSLPAPSGANGHSSTAALRVPQREPTSAIESLLAHPHPITRSHRTPATAHLEWTAADAVRALQRTRSVPEVGVDPTSLIQAAWVTLQTSSFNDSSSHFTCPFIDPVQFFNDPDLAWTQPGWTAFAWRQMHDAVALAPSLVENPMFAFDYVDLTRQVLSNLAAEFYLQFTWLYNVSQNATSFFAPLESLGATFLSFFDLPDSVLGTHDLFLLGNWTQGAQALAAQAGDPGAAALYDLNAKMLLTLWGGELDGYANRQYAGLFQDYYKPRWALFVDAVEEALASKTAYNQSDMDATVTAVETAWATGSSTYSNETSGDLVAAVDALYTQFGGNGSTLVPLFDVYVDWDYSVNITAQPLYTQDLVQMMWICLQHPLCVGVNSEGALKAAGGSLVPTTGVVYFARNS